MIIPLGISKSASTGFTRKVDLNRGCQTQDNPIKCGFILEPNGLTCIFSYGASWY